MVDRTIEYRFNEIISPEELGIGINTSRLFESLNRIEANQLGDQI